jgi:hypothetical protein
MIPKFFISWLLMAVGLPNSEMQQPQIISKLNHPKVTIRLVDKDWKVIKENVTPQDCNWCINGWILNSWSDCIESPGPPPLLYRDADYVCQATGCHLICIFSYGGQNDFCDWTWFPPSSGGDCTVDAHQYCTCYAPIPEWKQKLIPPIEERKNWFRPDCRFVKDVGPQCGIIKDSK